MPTLLSVYAGPDLMMNTSSNLCPPIIGPEPNDVGQFTDSLIGLYYLKNAFEPGGFPIMTVPPCPPIGNNDTKRSASTWIDEELWYASF